MRPRKKRNAEKRIEAVEYLIIKEVSEFEKLESIELEIGCGKGDFITEMARRNPDKLFVAVEKVSSVLITALEKADKMELKNIMFANIDVLKLEEIKNTAFCDRIYLNFSDPWPRKRHIKRRLTSERFLEMYKKLLKSGGEIHLKTDNKELFDFSLETLAANGFEIKNVTRDLHSAPHGDNIMTEYEKNFVSQGLPIFRLEAKMLAF